MNRGRCKRVVAKIGTLASTTILIRPLRDWKIGDRVEFAEDRNGSEFQTGIVTQLEPILFIDKF